MYIINIFIKYLFKLCKSTICDKLDDIKLFLYVVSNIPLLRISVFNKLTNDLFNVVASEFL